MQSKSGDHEHLRDDLALAQRAALAGAALGLRYFARVSELPQELKADGSIVTEADRAVEETVRGILLRERPADAFLGEETGVLGSGSRRWILDGIDGTAVFVKGDDRWQTLIALEEAGQITVGLAVIPAQKQLWWAARGLGAFVATFTFDSDSNGEGDGDTLGAARRLAVRPAPASLHASRLGIVPPLDVLPAAYRSVADRLLTLTRSGARSAHAALLVAAGELDLAVQLGGAVWDFAALSLIVTEAGGVVSGVNGQEHPITDAGVYASSAALHAATLAHLAALLATPHSRDNQSG